MEQSRLSQAQLITVPKNPKKRVTMIKHVVGKVRTSSYCLPEDDFVYGIANKFDREGAGQVIQSWATSIPSQPQTTMQSFPATNRSALKNGFITAKSQRTFAKNFPVMKQNPRNSSLLVPNNNNNENNNTENNCNNCNNNNNSNGDISTHVTTSPDAPPSPRPFGIKSVANECPMTILLQSPHFQNTPTLDETDYPDQSHMKKKGRLPPAKSTKASRLRQELVLPQSEEMVERERRKVEFKLRRFLRVESKVKDEFLRVGG